MRSDEEEIELTGGNSNASVVRVGDTVRRETSSVSPTVHKLLGHLDQQGFHSSPKYLGIDSSGRETLSFIDGTCGIDPVYWQDENYLLSAANLITQLHAATVNYPKDDNDNWGFVYADKTMHEVICHNDFGPYNLIVNEGTFTGVIDFDLAGPGPKLRDIAYAAYWLVPLSQRATDMREQALSDMNNECVRLKRFCSACGVQANTALLDMVGEVLAFMGNKQLLVDSIGDETATKLEAEGHLDHWQAEYAAFNSFRPSLERHF